MTNLEFVRIDDRLIHGQVVAAWLHAYSKVSHILVVDDKTSKDQFMLDMFKMLVPAGITIEVKNVDDAAGILKGGLTSGRKKLFQNVSASDAERQIFKEFIAAGTTVEVQIIPASKTVNVAGLVK